MGRGNDPAGEKTKAERERKDPKQTFYRVDYNVSLV